MSPNGTILAGIIDRQALIVTNSLVGKSTGLITRLRNTEKSLEQSVIDFVLISSDMVSQLVSCHVDSERKHVLTKITKKKQIESDHNSIITRFNIKWQNKPQEENIEIFNFKDDIGKQKFKEMTSNNCILSSIFDSKNNINIQTMKFLKRLNGMLHACFKKIKITPNSKEEKEISDLYKQQKILKFKTDVKSMKKLEEVKEKLEDKLSEDMFWHCERRSQQN